MKSAIRVLLQTTIPTTLDDWSISRFGALAGLLRAQRHPDGSARFDVVARDRGPPGQPDPVLSRLDTTDFDQMWLFAVDEGDGLTAADGEAISRFHAKGRGLLVARDHMDLGCSSALWGKSAGRTISTATISIPMKAIA